MLRQHLSNQPYCPSISGILVNTTPLLLSPYTFRSTPEMTVQMVIGMCEGFFLFVSRFCCHGNGFGSQVIVIVYDTDASLGGECYCNLISTEEIVH